MLKTIIVAATVALTGTAYAQSTQNSSKYAPGQQMHKAKKSTAPGASEYAPGPKMQNAKKSTAPGASEYAPGHQGTTVGSTGTKTKSAR
jgi:hypothetical protein